MTSPSNQTMDRDLGTNALRDTLGSCNSMEVRQYRRGWLQEFFCCTTRSDFRYMNGDEVVARSREDFAFVCRCCFSPCHPFDMTLKDTKTKSEFIEINRPFRCCMGQLKCCLLQEVSVFSGDDHLGDIQESCWYCVPQFRVVDQNEEEVYVIRPPSCANGVCMDCFPEGKNPCPFGCCMIPCYVYDAAGEEDAEPIGRMAKIPKATFKETFNEINYYKIDFPKGANTHEKGLLLGSSLLINALYFEHSE